MNWLASLIRRWFLCRRGYHYPNLMGSPGQRWVTCDNCGVRGDFVLNDPANDFSGVKIVWQR